MKEKANDNWLVTAKIVTAISILGILLSYALPYRLNILAKVILLAIPLYYLAISMLKKLIPSKLITVWTFEAVILGFSLFRCSDYYFFIENGIKCFYLAAIIIGVLVGILLPFSIKKTYQSLSERISNSVTIAICVTMVSIVVLPHLNYTLDLSKAQKKAVEISGKKASSAIRGPDKYEFMFENEGENCFISVPEDIYDKYNSGDTFQLLVYDGAFGEEFYIGEDCTTKNNAKQENPSLKNEIKSQFLN